VGKAVEAAASREASPEFIQRSVAVLVRQARAGVPTALAMGASLGFILVPRAGWSAFLAWYAGFAVPMLARQAYFARRLQRDGPTEGNLRRIALVSALTGWMASTSVPIFAPVLSSADIGVLTVVIVGWVALAVSVLAVQPRVYALYIFCCLATVYVGWLRHASTPDMLLIGLAMCLGAPMLVRLAWTVNDQLRETVEAAQEKMLLVEQLREALKNQQEAQRARSRFLGAASHDLRQPVQALLFLADIFRKSTDAARRDAMAQQIIRTAHSIDGMFRHLVDFAQIDAGTMRAVVQPVQVERLVAAASSGFAEKCAAKGLRFRTELQSPCSVSADPVLLERMLRNFLDNAYKYSKEGEIVLRVQREAGDALVCVADQGVGMDADDLAQACNAFYRGRSAALAEAEGIGLGLAISSHMADLMHSRLQMESEPGRGTQVSMRLPLAQDAVARHARVEQRGTPLRGLLVAVLEDDRLTRDAVCAWLQEAGARVLNGGTAAQLLQVLKAEGDAPDLMLADFRLADGSGIEAIEAVRAQFGPVPAVVMSGEPDIAERRLPLPVLQKPVAPERLLEALQAALAGPQTAVLHAPP
jgi:two-component system, sensor histidine kinase